MNKLTDTLELWLQEQINTCCMGLFDRLDRLELENLRKDHEIRDLYRYLEIQGKQVVDLEEVVDNLVTTNLALTKRVEDLEAGRVQQPTSSFTDRVCEVFDTEEFKTTVQELIHDWIADSDVVCSTDDVVRILEETTFNIRVR